MSRSVQSYDEVKDLILEAVDDIAKPIRQTMSPKGNNVIYETIEGEYNSTNDGVTIAKQISSDDPVKRAIIDVIKTASLQTNQKVGDGTSTTILLAHVLIKEAFKLKDDGMSPVEIKKHLLDFQERMVNHLDSMKQEIEYDDEIIRQIAHISANNDPDIADDIYEAMQHAKQDGFIQLNLGGDETEIEFDDGFVIHSGVTTLELLGKEKKPEIELEDVPVLITNKRIYHKEEVHAILRAVLDNGHKNVVIVARDFIGESEKIFIKNYASDKGLQNIILIKDPLAEESDPQSLEDLGMYLNGSIVSNSYGDMVNNLTFDNFCVAKSVKVVGEQKSIFKREQVENEKLDDRIQALQEKRDKDDDDIESRVRLGCLVGGLTTIKIGGKSDIERRERQYRYEDAIHAARAALDAGVIIGGGMGIWAAYKATEMHYPDEVRRVFYKTATAPISQILVNCGKHVETYIKELEGYAIDGSVMGYDAANDEVVDLKKAGVVDPVKVAKESLKAAVSITREIIGSNYLILFENEQEESGTDDE